MVFKLIKFIFSFMFTIVSSIFSVKFDGISLWSITLFLLILIAFLKILLAPIFSGEQAPVYIREKGYYKILDDHYKAKPEKEYFRTYEKFKPGKWRR